MSVDVGTGLVLRYFLMKFCLDMPNLEGKRGLNRSGVLAGANFIALRRVCVEFVHAFIPWCEALSFGEAFRRKPCFNKK